MQDPIPLRLALANRAQRSGGEEVELLPHVLPVHWPRRRGREEKLAVVKQPDNELHGASTDGLRSIAMGDPVTFADLCGADDIAALVGSLSAKGVAPVHLVVVGYISADRFCVPFMDAAGLDLERGERSFEPNAPGVGTPQMIATVGQVILSIQVVHGTIGHQILWCS